MKLDLKQIKFCADECARQQSGEQSVAAMCLAYFHAVQNSHSPLTDASVLIDVIKDLALFIEPEKNRLGYRIVPVTKQGGLVIGVPAEQIPVAMHNLAEAVVENRISADRTYMEFERIHPFIDGNGRVGAILFNMLRGSLEDPIVPSDLFA